MLGQRQERGRAAVIRDELLDGDAAGEGDRILETEPPDVAADAIEITRGHRRRTDEVEVCGAIGLAIFRERRDHIGHRLVRQDLPHREDRGALVGERARDFGVWRAVEVLPVHERRDDRGVREPGGFELLAVVLAVGDPELGRLGELLQLLAPELREGFQIVV